MRLRFIVSVLVVLVLSFSMINCKVNRGSKPFAVYGERLNASLNPSELESIRIIVLDAPEPYQPAGVWESRDLVTETTTGILTLSYTDLYGKAVKIERTIKIDNITRAISYNGRTIKGDLKEIFYPLPSPLGKKTVTLLLHFDDPLIVSLWKEDCWRSGQIDFCRWE